jgi:phage baseplate assembly protein W
MNIRFPFQFDSRGRTASIGDENQIREMLEQLLFTMPGERVNRPDFGSGLMQLIFAPNSPELSATVQFTMQAALQFYLKDVSAENSQLRIDLQYVIRRTNQTAEAQFLRAV